MRASSNLVEGRRGPGRFYHLRSAQDLGPVYGVILTAALSASGVGAQWTHRMREHLASWGGWHPHKGRNGACSPSCL